MVPFRSNLKTYTVFTDSGDMVLLGEGSTTLLLLGKDTIECWVKTSPHTH